MTELVIKRVIAAPPHRLFAAWTTPELLLRWWGPPGVRCIGAEIDLRAGGAYRIGNQLPDGNVLWITGAFELVEAPHRLIYSWQIGEEPVSRVTVSFAALDGGATEVMVLHERIHSTAARDGHATGWVGCLDGLEGWAAAAIA